MKAIYFDLDGTIADLYGQVDWLENLHNEVVRPYEVAEPLVNMDELNSMLCAVAAMGVTIGVISWGAMGGSNAYTREVKKAKVAWVKRYLTCVSEFHVVKYGTPKHQVRKIKDSVLIDDSPQVRDKWQGETVDATNPANIFEFLEKVLNERIN